MSQQALKIPVSDFQVGDRVQVVDREATPDETKKRLFFNHMRGLIGSIRRVYAEEDEIWVDVDRGSLPTSVLQRHETTETQMRKKWLDGISDEARRKLRAEESKFSLRYSILVSPDNLILKERDGGNQAPKPIEARNSAPATLADLNDSEREFMNRAEAGPGSE